MQRYALSAGFQLPSAIREAGFRETQGLVRTLTDEFVDVDAVLAFSRASSFGNHLAGFTEVERSGVIAALERELEARRARGRIVLRRRLLYAIAEKGRAECGCRERPALEAIVQWTRG